FVVKAPQFSFMQMEGAEPTIGVEMRSTGEVACFGATLAEAMSRALIAAGLKIPSRGDNGIVLADELSDLTKAASLLMEFKNSSPLSPSRTRLETWPKWPRSRRCSK
ncbi:MAG: hypothetical protein OK455_11345, partial [Thaumarchaeota archaeon]|nr:hypothetical protein [Nitrososphaerota archaeon]